MYKLLIVEDEKWEREGLVNFLDWSELGFIIAGTAANGIQGLRLAEEYQPHIIITDIKMPKMDGIEFTREVKKVLPDCRIIIITGYDDFDYAKEAIQLGVYEYLLKPIQKCQLLDVLSKTVKSISDEINREKNERGIKQQIEESVYESRERALLNLIEGSIENENDLKAADYFNMTFRGNGFLAVVIGVNIYPFIRRKGYGEGQLPLREFYRMVRKAVGEEGIAALKNTGVSEIILCLPAGDDWKNHICDIIRRIRREYCGAEIPETVIGIGSVTETLQGLAGSYLQAKAALDSVFFMKDAEILFYDDIPHREDLRDTETYVLSADITGYSKKILSAVASSDSQAVINMSEELFEFIDRQSVGKDFLCLFLAGLIGEISTLLISNDESLSFKGMNDDVLRTLQQFIKVENMKEWVLEILLHANYRISEKKNNREEYIVGEMMEIIHKNYMESIGIGTIADKLELSPNYLGGLFRKHMGKRFTEVLTEFRMKKAEERLTSGSGNVIETAKAVGFINVAHFCTVFKKTHGISPAEYQKRYSGNMLSNE